MVYPENIDKNCPDNTEMNSTIQSQDLVNLCICSVRFDNGSKSIVCHGEFEKVRLVLHMYGISFGLIIHCK